MAENTNSKMKLLRSISGIGGVSDRCLSSILEWVREHPEIVDVNSSCRDVSRAATSSTRNLTRELKVQPKKRGADLTWDILPLQRSLPYLCAEAPCFRQALIEAARKRSNALEPLHLILYSDGITPGAALTAHNQRKSIVWYASLREFGWRLSYEEVWLPVAFATISFIKTVLGGVSNLTRAILVAMFCSDDSIQTAGVVLPIGDNDTYAVLHIAFACLLGDEAALTDMWDIKGHGGMIPCGIVCSCCAKPLANDVENGIAALAERHETIVDITCDDTRAMGLRKDADVWALCDILEAAPNNTERDHLQQCYGINYCSAALLFDKPLRIFIKPASSNRFDIMHIVFSNGALSLEIYLFLQATKRSRGIYFKNVREHFGQKQWRARGSTSHSQLLEVFSESRENSSVEMLKAGASELLSVYPCFRDYILETIARDDETLEPVMDSMLVLLEICDLLRQALRHPGPARIREIANTLKFTVPIYLKAFLIAHGIARFRLKHHELMHVAQQLLDDSLCLSCWPLERKNIKAKESLQNNKAKVGIEQGGLARMINSQLRMLSDPGWASRLLKPIKECPDLAIALGASSVTIASAMHYRGVTVRRGCASFLGQGMDTLVIVIACISADGMFGIIFRKCHQLCKSNFKSTWRVLPGVECQMVDVANALFLPACERYESADSIVVLH